MVFKSDKHTMAGYSNGSQSPELNRIVEGTHIEGDIKSILTYELMVMSRELLMLRED